MQLTTSEAVSLSVVVMAYNEEDSLPLLLEELVPYLESHPRLSDWEVVVVDDGSADRTADVVEEWSQRVTGVSLYRHPRNMGMGAAIRTGYSRARCDFVTQLPADLQVPPQTFDLFLPHIPESDIVLSVYENRGEGPGRRFLAAGYRAVARLLLGQRADYTGTMMFRRELVDRISITTDTFVANLEFPLAALDLGAKMHLVTFTPSPRRAGESKVANSRRILFVFRELLALRRHRASKQA